MINNYIKNQVRIENQAALAIREELNRRKAEKEQTIVEENKKLMEGASYTVNASIHRNKQRVKTLVESLEYKDKMSKSAMCEMLTKAVKGALLLDESEYRGLNPNYENEIKSLVESFMENADLNMEIEVPETLQLIEHISRTLPETKTGILLNENQILESMNLGKMDDVLKELSKNISKRVAKLVSDEKEEKASIVDDINQVQASTVEPSELPQDAAIDTNAAIAQPEMAPQMPDAPVVDPNEVTAQEMPAEVPQDVATVQPETAQAPVEQPVPQYQTRGEILQAYDNREIDLDTANQLLKELEIQGSMATNNAAEEVADENTISDEERNAAIEFAFKDIKKKNALNENAKLFIKTTPKTGLLETFAVNEGIKMINEGKEYNGNLALANALTYITVLEAFNQSGLLTIDDAKYGDLVSLAGGKMSTKKEQTEAKQNTVADVSKNYKGGNASTRVIAALAGGNPITGDPYHKPDYLK